MDLPQEQGVETAIQSIPSPKVSVIVPVYKAETYLNRCVDSLLAQTFEDFEILLIDDGSPDRSGEICDEYARKDPRVRVIHKENGGVSSARQCGLDNARGEYVIHADPDDWTEPEMLEEMYRKAKEEDADMVICDFFIDKDGKSKYVCQEFPPLRSDEMVDLFFRSGGIFGSCWNKMVRRDCFERLGISFPPNLYLHEDVCMNVLLFSEGISIAYLSKAYYHYVRDVNPASLTFSTHKREYFLIANQIFLELLEKRLPISMYSNVEWFVKEKIIIDLLRIGGENLKSPLLKELSTYQRLVKLPISRKRKFIYWIAFYVSPKMAHCFLHGILLKRRIGLWRK